MLLTRFQETLDVLESAVPRNWPIHLHCFNESPEYATKMLCTNSLLSPLSVLASFANVFFGIGGQIVTPRPGSTLPQIVKDIIPHNRLLLEVFTQNTHL